MGDGKIYRLTRERCNLEGETSYQDEVDGKDNSNGET